MSVRVFLRGFLSLIQVETLRRVHNVGFLLGQLICEWCRYCSDSEDAQADLDLYCSQKLTSTISHALAHILNICMCRLIFFCQLLQRTSQSDNKLKTQSSFILLIRLCNICIGNLEPVVQSLIPSRSAIVMVECTLGKAHNLV